MLSPGTEYWLRNCSITCSPEGVAKPAKQSDQYGLGRPYLVEVSFPGNGELYEVVYALPRRAPPKESSN